MPKFNDMTPRTRAMIVVTVIVTFIAVAALGVSNGDSIVLLAPLALYWGYRFVKSGTNIQ